MSPRFVPAEGLGDVVHRILERERARLADVRDATLEVTGASSLPGALTGGDIDLHLRVSPERFAAVVATLSDRYEVVHPEIWTDTLATFRVPGRPEVGVAATPIGSEHDRRFRAAWLRLRTDPAALAAYNEMKRAHEGAPTAEYLAAKRAFFDALAGAGPMLGRRSSKGRSR